MVTWVKVIEDKNYIGGKQVTYKASIEGGDLKFSFSDFFNDGVRLHLDLPHNNAKKLVKEQWEKLKVQEIDWLVDLDPSVSSIDQENQFKFIKGIHNVYPFNQEIYNEILIDIKVIDVESMQAKIKQYVNTGKFKEIFDEIISLKIDDLLFYLANCCEHESEWQNAVTCYESFEKDSIYFKKANDKIIEIIDKMYSSADLGEISLTQEEREYYRRVQFSCGLNSGDQQLANRLFHGFCGKGFFEKMINVQAGADTLLELASEVRALREEIKQLKTNEALKSRSFLNNAPVNPSSTGKEELLSNMSPK